MKDRVDKSDADLVQIVHTNSGTLLDGCLSFKVQSYNVKYKSIKSKN